MKEIVIFCQSYDQVENALYVATCSYASAAVTVVLQGRYNLFKFWQVINEKVFRNRIDIVYFEFLHQGRTAGGNKIEKALRLLLDIPRERRYLKTIFDKHFAEVRGAEVWFFNKRYSTYSYYLLKKLSKANRLVYMHSRSDSTLIRKVTPTNIAEVLSLIIWKLTCGSDIVMGKVAYGSATPCMPDKFLNRKVYRIIDCEESNGIMKDFDLSRFRIFDVGNYSVMYFGQYLVQVGYISDRDTFRKELTQISNILAKYFRDDEIAIKHSGAGNPDPMITIGKTLPDYIPAEFLYSENTKMYLTICSTSLANVEKGLAVSLLDLITFESDGTREQMRELLMGQSHSKILFPKSLDEFEQIVAGIKQQTGA